MCDNQEENPFEMQDMLVNNEQHGFLLETPEPKQQLPSQ
jgi:hypothetical protein